MKGSPENARDTVSLAAAYVTNFGALASSSPFFAVYLGYRGFSAEAIANVSASLLLIGLVATPAWTFLADRFHAVGGVLRVVCVLAALMFATLLLGLPRAEVVIALLAFAAIRAPFGALIDTLALKWARETNRTFGGLRAWGTAGYTLAALVTGALVAKWGPRAILVATTTILALAVISAFMLPARGSGTARPRVLRSALELSHSRRFRLLLAASALQELGLAPYDALYPAYLTEHANALAAGIAIAVGAGAEFVFLIAGGSLLPRLGPSRLLAVACALSAVRWATLAWAAHPIVLVGVQVLHSFGFGAFYVSAVAIVDEECPASAKASGQGLFGAITFGVAGAIALSFAGAVAQRVGLRAVFAMASAASSMAAIVALRIGRASTR